MDRHFIETDIYYTKKEDHLDTDKPYMLRYKDPNRPPTNMETETRANTKIRDMRTIPNLNLDEHGFDTMQYDSLMSYDQYENEETVMKIHVPQIEEVLRKHYGAKRVESVRHKVSGFLNPAGIGNCITAPPPLTRVEIIRSDAVIRISEPETVSLTTTINQLPWHTSVRMTSWGTGRDRC